MSKLSSFYDDDLYIVCIICSQNHISTSIRYIYVRRQRYQYLYKYQIQKELGFLIDMRIVPVSKHDTYNHIITCQLAFHPVFVMQAPISQNVILSNVKFSIVYQTNWFLLLFFFVKELWHESFFILKKLLKFFLRIRIGLQIIEVVYDNWFHCFLLVAVVVVKIELAVFNREKML